MNPAPTLPTWLQLLGLLAAEGALVVAAAALLQRWVSSAVWRRTIWQGSVAGLLLLVVIELSGAGRAFVGWMLAGSQPPKAGANRSAAGEPGEPASATPPQLRTEFLDRVAERVAYNRQREISEAASAPFAPVGQSVRNSAAPSAVPEWHDSVFDSMAILWLGIVWGVGAVLVLSRACAARLLCVFFRLRRPLVADRELEERARAIAGRLRFRRRIYFVESSRLTVPIAFGIFRPTIGLPGDFSSRFSDGQQETMLAHELAHLAARDPVWYLLADLAAAILWWHPLVWWNRRQLHAASEAAADEASLLVANGPSVLAECLVQFGAQLTRGRPAAWMGVEGSGLRSALGRRVEHLVRLRGRAWSPPGRLRVASAKAVGSMALAGATLLCTAWVGPQTLNKGESMKNMKETWKRSLAAFALLTTLGTEDNVALSANADQRSDDTKARPAEITAEPAAGKSARFPAREPSADEQRLTKVYPLKYSDPTGMVEALKPALSDPSRIVTDERTRSLIVVGSPNELRDVGALIAKLDKKPAGNVLGEGAVHEETSPEHYNRLMMERYGLIPKGSASSATDSPVNNEKNLITSRLERIVLSEVMFDSLPLPQVVDYLKEEATKRDPEGINFLINPNVPAPAVTHAIDPTTGLPVAAPAAEPLDMNSVIIRINPPLKNVRLKDALDAVMKVADRPIQYSVEPYGVVISQDGDASQHASVQPPPAEPTMLQVRTFKVDTNIFLAGVERAFGISLGSGSGADNFDAQKIRIKLEQAEKDVKRVAKNVETGLVPPDDLEKAKLTRDLLALDLKQVESGRGKAVSESKTQTHEIQSALRRLLTQLGINMDLPSKAVFYNELTGIVMVRASYEDLEIVKAAIETLGGFVVEANGSQLPTRDSQFYQNEMMRRYGLLPSNR